MTALDVLAEVEQAGGALYLEGDALRVKAPVPLPADLMARLRETKADVLRILRDGTAAPWPEGWPPWPVKAGCVCVLCDPAGNGYQTHGAAFAAVLGDNQGGKT